MSQQHCLVLWKKATGEQQDSLSLTAFTGLVMQYQLGGLGELLFSDYLQQGKQRWKEIKRNKKK